MLQIFTTQLQGKLKEAKEHNIEEIEDASRLLAQALISNGQVLIHGTKEMQGVLAEALYGKETLSKVSPLFKADKSVTDWTPVDRILLFARESNDKEAVDLATSLQEKGATIISISNSSNGNQTENDLRAVSEIHIDTKLTTSLVPTDEGTRTGFPSLILSLFVYHCLVMTVTEILDEQ